MKGGKVKTVGHCKKCGAPMFWKLEVDNNGYKVKSFRCWNGHYKDLIVLSLSTAAGTDMQKVKFIHYKCSKCGGSFNFIQRFPSVNGDPIPVHGVCRNCKKEFTITLYVRNGTKCNRKMKKIKPEEQMRKKGNSSLS